jgi:hypothetical protein
MRIILIKSIRGIIVICFFAALLSCAAWRSGNGLSPDELAYYSDSFDKMREDLWDISADLYRDKLVRSFIQADLDFSDGQLIIRTKTDNFSKGGLSSRFYLAGDFDIQIDCRMDFKFGNFHMDQVFSFVAIDKISKPEKTSFVSIGLALAGGGDRGTLFSHCVLNGKPQKGFMHQINSFKGSLRIVRNGTFITTSYKEEGSSGWSSMNTYHLTADSMRVGFQLRNFLSKRTAIVAADSVSAEIDGFKINAAREIIEEKR